MYAFDLHTHTSQHSACSRMSAEELMDRGIELGLAGVVVVDHHYQWPQDELQALADKQSAGKLVALSGYELTTTDPRTEGHGGDLLIFGTPERSAMELWTPYDEACARVREQHGLIIAAHPYRQGAGAGDRVVEMDIDGIEVFNQNHSRLDVSRARAAVLRAGFLGVAGSDAHRVAQLGQFLTVFERPVRDVATLMAELWARRFVLQSNRPDIS